MHPTKFSASIKLMILSVLLLGSVEEIAADTGTGSVSLTTIGSPVTENFDTLSNVPGSLMNTALPTGWYITEQGGGGRDNEQYAVDTGASNTGDTYSYGAAASTERALGGLQSGTLIPFFGAKFTNNTGTTITSLNVSYTGEEWRLGTAGRTDRIDFQISTDATDLLTGTYTDVNPLDFTTPDTAGTAGARDGNSAPDRTAISATISSLNIPNGATFFIRWIDFDAGGADDGLAVDDFSVTPNGSGGATPTPTPSGTPTASATPTPSATPASVRIRDIQGVAHLSPLTGQVVANVPGIVTAKISNGFYMQDPSPDANDATSEGIFVFTSTAPTVNVGDAVAVGGTVAEFRSGGSGSTNLTGTEISTPTVSIQSTGNSLPAPIVLGTGGRIPPNTVIEDDAAGSVETSGVFDPSADGIDFYESLEYMRVQVNGAVVVGPRGSVGEIPVLSDDGANASVRTTRGGIVVRATDFNPERIILDDLILATPVVHVGDHFSGPVVGVMDYGFGNFKLEITQALTAVPAGLARETTAIPTATQLAIATFNVENLDPGDPPAQFTALAGLIVNNLRSPDIIVVEEIQDNNGPTNDSVVDATTTYNTLITAIQTAGGPTYVFRQINPVDDQDGGEPGGNIRVGFLFRTDRGLAFTDRAGGCSTCATTVANGPSGVELSFSPGRVDPTNTAFNASRKPLAGEFTFNGQKLFVIGNHFNSKGGDDPLFGRFQPPVLSSEIQRTQQAQIVNNFVDSILALDANAKIVVLGDLNDFSFSTPLNTLKGGVLNDLIETLPQSERYTYVFEGNSQDLDHILLSNGLFSGVFAYDVVHVNAEFADQISDHDPQVVRLTLAGSVTPTPTPTPTLTPTPTASPTVPPVTPTPSPTATDFPSPTATASVTATPSPGSPSPSPCGHEVIVDGGFESGGIPNTFWNPETSTNFGTPLCDVPSCGTGGGASPPRNGAFWLWFGGIAAPETATLGQTVVIPSGGPATLHFWMRVGTVTAPFTDVVNVRVDGAIVQSFLEPAVAEGAYTERSVNLNAFANNASHALLFEYVGPSSGTGSFVIDDVSLIAGGGTCPSPTPSGTPSPTPSVPPTATPSPSATVPPTPSPTVSPSATVPPTPSPSATASATPSATASPTASPCFNQLTFLNPAPITINDAGAANPYPSNITVSGVSGAITNVTVSIAGFNHTFPSDVDMLLVSPTGAKFILVSDVIGGTDAVGINWTFDDAAVAFIGSTGTPASGTFKPTNYTTCQDPFAAPAPAGPYLSPGGIGTPCGSDTLFASVFGSTNGTWSLYVVDDLGADVGSISGGWSVTFTVSGVGCPSPTPSATVTPGTPSPTATPSTTPSCPPVITQSSTQTITPLNSVSCNNGTGHTDNSYWRAFTMNSFVGSSAYCVTSVSFGIEQATGAGGTQPVTVRLYTSNQPFPTGFPASLTQVGTATVNVPDSASNTVFQLPITATVPAGAELVMEVFTPDGTVAGNLLFIGSNADPESGPSYLSAAGCGINTPTTTAAIGFPNMHIVFNIFGSCSCGVSPTPTATIPPTTPTPTATPTTTIPPMTPTPTTTIPPTTPTPSPTATIFPSPSPTIAPSPTPTPSATPTTRAINLSTRLRVDVNDRVGIGGFIITGSAPKTVLLRAIGPSLAEFGFPNVLPDPVLELHGPGFFFPTVINDNWRDTQEIEIQQTGIPPTNDLESAILATLEPGAYTAIVRGNPAAAERTGLALVEVYDLNQTVDSKLANLSTRALVRTGSDIVIAGFLLSDGNGADRIVVRGLGPSLAQYPFSAADVLADPVLELRDSNGTLLVANNDWQDNPAQAAEIIAAGLAPANALESGIAATLPPGIYTALLAGTNFGTGVGLVEVYDRGP